MLSLLSPNQTLAINELNPEHILPNSHYSMILVVTASVVRVGRKISIILTLRNTQPCIFFRGERKDVFPQQIIHVPVLLMLTLCSGLKFYYLKQEIWVLQSPSCKNIGGLSLQWCFLRLRSMRDKSDSIQSHMWKIHYLRKGNPEVIHPHLIRMKQIQKPHLKRRDITSDCFELGFIFFPPYLTQFLYGT